MRWHLVAALFVGTLAVTIGACGSDTGSEFTDGVDAGEGASSSSGGSSGGSSSGGTFVPTGDAGPPPDTCKPRTCTDAKANCGPIGDGCGGIVQCGDCTGGETCGGGGTPSVCGKPACTPKTCADLGAECGPAGDGCGGLIPSCGTCEAGSCSGTPSKCTSGGGNTDGGACVPTKTACGPGDCGPIADGCGGILECEAVCPAGEICGGGNVASQCGKPPCKKETCGDATCGFKADGCGGLLNCWPDGTTVCPPGQQCGGANVANQCGTPANCTGLCLQQQGCAGGATTSIEGYVTSPNGALPIPNAVVYVPNGAVTAFTQGVSCESCATASGSPLITTTTDANGHFLLPNMPVSTPGKVVDIPVVVQLGRWRKQLTVQTTACTNTKVPAVDPADPTKLVGGAARPATDKVTGALARNKAEGDIPLTAISTGSVDGLECVFRKMGVADGEFTHGLGTGRIHLYQDDGEGSGDGGACAPGCGNSCGDSGDNAKCPQARALYGGFRSAGNLSSVTGGTPIKVKTSNNHGLSTGDKVVISGAANAKANGEWTVTRIDKDEFSLNGSTGAGNGSGGTWGACDGVCGGQLDKYDAVIFGCVGGQSNKPAEARNSVLKYADKGGRVFATHYSYVWLYSTSGSSDPRNNFTSPWAATADKFNPGRAGWDSKTAPGSISAYLDTSFPKGVLFSNWLQAPVGAPPASYPPPYAPVDGLWKTTPPQIALTEPRADIDPSAASLATSGIVSPAQRWIYTDTTSTVFNPGTGTGQDKDPARNAPMHYTFNTPWSAAPANQCGRVLFSDFHVSLGNTEDKVFPAECNNDPLTAQEKVLAYMLFDLASCVSTTGPTECKPKTCAEQGIGCGQAGDGCGNVIQCDECPRGTTCGGGGVPNQCGKPDCAPVACKPGECGLKGDGCGDKVNCGDCQGGQICGGGGPNLCGAGACTPTVCPAPGAGTQCGPVANGCGGVNNCPCPNGVPCVNGTCGTPPCTPRTCQAAGANCGQIADGCGGIQNCGTCVSPQTCGGGGVANLCGGGVN